jgi:curved DNA-binding protein CbpA
MLEHMKSDRDYYEVLQISRKADLETVHRVYRMMATRFHPDNPRTGNTETFLLLKRAYQVLSDPARRAIYDSTRQIEDQGPLPIFELKEFVYGLTGEVNRRLGVLSLLYNQRRASLDLPGLSVLDLEKRMGFPREHLNFTLWYLRSKGYVCRVDNSDYGITSEGIDFIESHSFTDELVKRLIHAGPGPSTGPDLTAERGVKESSRSQIEATGDTHPAPLTLAN